MNRLRKIILSWPVITIVAAVAVYTLAGFFLVPYLVTHTLPKVVAEQLHRKAAVGAVRFNPYTFVFEMEDLRLEEPDGQPIAGFKRLSVDFESKSLIDRAWTFRRVHLEAPQVNLEVGPDGALNLARLAPPSPEPAPGAAAPPPLVFEEILIDQGRVDFIDRRQSKPAAIRLDPLRLELTGLSTLPGRMGPKSLAATIGEGGTIRWTGNIGLNPVVSRGRISIEGLRAATLAAFARDSLNLDPPEGNLGLSAEYELDLGGKAPRLAVHKLALGLSGLALKLKEAGAPFLELPDVRLAEGRLDLEKGEVEVGRVAVAGGRVRLAVDPAGALNLARMAKSPAASPAPATPPADPAGNRQPWKISLKAFDLKDLALDYRDASRTPGLHAALGALQVRFKAAVESGGVNPLVRVEEIAAAVAGVTAGLADTPEPPLRIDSFALEGGTYDLAENAFTAARIVLAGGALDVRLMPDGAVNLAELFAPPEKGAIADKEQEAAAAGRPFRFKAGTVSVAGLNTAFSDLSVRSDAPVMNLDEIALSVSEVDGSSPMKFDAGLRVRAGGEIKAAGTLDPAGPSVEAEIQVAGLDLIAFQPYLDRAVTLTLKSGKVSTAGTLRHGIPGAAARTGFQGGLKVEDFRLVEPGAGDTFLGWKALEVDQIKLQVVPNRLDVEEVRLAQPVGKFIIAADRTLNVAKVVKPGPSAAPAPGAAAEPFPVRVRKVTVADGKLDFADLSLTPQFGTKIHELRGVVAGIASTGNARAQVTLEGRVDEYGTAKIKGELNGSDPKAFTDIRMVFRNVEMKNLSPYSGKFAGRRIDSGKLSLDLKYQIEKSRMAGENQIVVERLKLGERVPNPEAADLPLDLAVALLEDSKGVIDIGLPVQGNLDAPEFDYGRLIGKALSGLMVKIVTSPFRALGALIPGVGEEGLSRVAFEPGESALPPPEKEKLVGLAEALRQRPQLKLVVQGRWHPASDGAKLRQRAVRQALAARLGAPSGPDQDPGPVDFGGPETLKAIEAMFTERFGAQELAVFKAVPAAAPAQSVKGAGQAGKDDAKPAAADPGGLAKALFLRLVEAEALPEAQLLRLAEARAKAVAAELGDAGGIPAERIEIKAPEALDTDKKEGVAAALNLKPAGAGG